MGSGRLICPLCCGEEFSCRNSLRRHLEQISHNLRCPACMTKVETLSDLVLHLEAEQCKLPNEEIITASRDETSENITEQPANANAEPMNNLVKMEFSNQEEPHQQLTFVDVGQNSLSVVEDCDNHILIVGNESGNILGNQNIITTQNDDGTISFTPVEPEETECTEEERLSPAEEDSEEVYSCNTCGVSFASVIEHIQQYHSEQDVVVEVAEPESETLGNEIQDELRETKRVITTSGNIVVQSYEHKDSDEVMEEEVVDKSGRMYMRRVIKIDKFWHDNDIPFNTDPLLEKNQLKESTTDIGTEKERTTKVYSCRRCLLKSNNIETLQNHYCKKDGVYNCTQCSASYTNPKSLCAHMKVHKTANKPSNVNTSGKKVSAEAVLMLFKCEVCDTVFPSNKSLRLHKRMHDPAKSRPMEGPVEYIATDSALGDSLSRDNYHCKICDKWIHVGYMEIHDNYHHSSAQHHCDICNRKFQSQDYLIMHMKVHNIEKASVVKSDKVLPYSCLYCNRQFARPHEKVKHERIHTGEKPHTCAICGKAFRVSYCLTLHMRTHTGARPYECQHCGKRFKAHSVYNHHLLTHSDVRAYKCPYCPKAFKTSVQLAGHKNSHTKPFSCTHCNRPFASLYAVRVHTETHRRQNNLNFSCKLCGASYARAFALKDHMKSVHGTVTEDVYTQPEAVFEPDPALAILPKKENSLEVEELSSSGNDSQMIIM